MKKVNQVYYEIKSPCGHYGLVGTFDSAKAALEEINFSHARAKARGFDNHEKWIIVRVEWERAFDDDGNWLAEKHDCCLAERAEYSDYEDEYVFVY